jgi:cell division protein FtsI (penicillin-binding protein 3)
MILDRNGEPLAVSTPMDSVAGVPEELLDEQAKWPQLAGLLGMPLSELDKLVRRNAGRGFMYLKRQVNPDKAGRILNLAVPGVSLVREYKRFYPAGSSVSHVVGYTDVDEKGIGGLELAFESSLRGQPGAKRVVRDGKRDVIRDLESLKRSVDGADLHTSLDMRLQHLVSRELEAAWRENKARSATAVLLDARSGEILALASQPGFNPNVRRDLGTDRSRNRAVTDVFEPGSTVKPFTIAAALDSGVVQASTTIDTAPGRRQIGRHTIRDTKNYARLTVREVLVHSSNVGAMLVEQRLKPDALWKMYRRVGLGNSTRCGLPGELGGHLPAASRWGPAEHATLAFGYGLSVTVLQLAQAYTAFANDGRVIPVSILRRDAPVQGWRAMSAQTAREVRSMLADVVSEGTGSAAQVPRYRTAGKTGTVHVATAGGYSEHRYVASFIGMAPADNPDLIMAVLIEEPSGARHFGGSVAAPVFSRVMAGALRLRNIAPDARHSVDAKSDLPGGAA